MISLAIGIAPCYFGDGGEFFERQAGMQSLHSRWKTDALDRNQVG